MSKIEHTFLLIFMPERIYRLWHPIFTGVYDSDN